MYKSPGIDHFMDRIAERGRIPYRYQVSCIWHYIRAGESLLLASLPVCDPNTRAAALRGADDLRQSLLAAATVIGEAIAEVERETQP